MMIDTFLKAKKEDNIMAYCEKCGTEIQDGVKFCSSCGETTQTQAIINDVEAHKILAVIAYIGVLVVIPLMTGKYKDSPYLKFHTNQSLVLCIGYIVSMILFFIPFVGAVSGSVLTMAVIVLQVIGIIGAVKGEMKSLPLIDKIEIIK